VISTRESIFSGSGSGSSQTKLETGTTPEQVLVNKKGPSRKEIISPANAGPQKAMEAQKAPAASEPVTSTGKAPQKANTGISEEERAFDKLFSDNAKMTPPAKKIEYMKGIRSKQRDAKMLKQEALRKLDDTTEQVQAEHALREKALAVLKTGTPLEFLLNGFRLNHAGHEENARAIIYAFCAQSSATSKGIQPEVTGSKGSGKSHSIASTLFLMPEEYIWESSFSPKYLYYKPPQQGCIIYIDERLSEDLMNLVKKIMSNFQRETRHSTLVERGKPVELIIPKRIVIMGSTVNGAGDDQYNDRTVQVGIVNTQEDDKKYYEFESQRRAEGRPEFQVNDHILTCRAMLRHIREREFIVTIPRIRFAYLHDKRLINILFDFVEASAILNYMQRDYEEKDKIVTVTPNKEDLNAALNFEMFRMNNAEAEGRLTRAETALHQTIQGVIKNTESEFTESEIADLYGKSQNAIRKLLYGDGGTQGHVTGGLVDKTPGWYTISPAVNPDLRGQNVIRAKKVQTSIGGSYAAFTE